MTRRELREHCFKMLFGTAFYPIEEADDQISTILRRRTRTSSRRTAATA